MKGLPTYVALPYEEIPDKFKKINRPVFRLRRALYGHPEAGAYWEEKVDKHLKAVGFETLNPEWPSCYFHPQLKVYCVVYVDDFKISGPIENITKAWDPIRQEGGLVIEPPKKNYRKRRSILGMPNIQENHHAKRRHTGSSNSIRPTRIPTILRTEISQLMSCT